MAGICRVTGVSFSKLYDYIITKYAKTPRKLKIIKKNKGKLTVQMDELWSFVVNPGNKQCNFLAMDAYTCEIVGLHIGDRSQKSAGALWDSLPPGFKSVLYAIRIFGNPTFVNFPQSVINRLFKKSGKTSLIERLNWNR